jgi:hypothetical protein
VSEERQRVLRMLKAGKVTVEEAEALLEALGESESQEPAGRPAAGDVAAQAASGVPPADDQPAGRRGEFRRMVDDLMKAVDVEGIVENVRETLRRSKVDVDRVKDEVLRATDRVREETRRAAREYRRHGWAPVSRTIEGLWGLTPTASAWSHEADLPAGRRVAVHNLWGDVQVTPSADGRLRVTAVTRAWGRDETEAQAVRDAIRITAAGDDAGCVIKVAPPAGGVPRRFRVDFAVEVPEGAGLEVSLAKGDVTAGGLRGAVDVTVASGDVAVRDHEGSVRIDVARGDVVVDGASSVRVQGKHGDVTLTAIAGAAAVRVMHGDVLLREPAGPVQFDVETARGDITAEAPQLVPGTTSRASTISGDISVRLGPHARCRLSVRVVAGEIQAPATLADRQENRRTLRGVYGGADAQLDLSTVSGDVTVEGTVADVQMGAATVGD